MATKRIAGITIEIGGDTSNLVSALSKVDKSLATTQTNLRDINKALKFDPSNTELLKDRQNELSRAIDDTKNKLEQEKQAYQQLSNADQTPENTEKMRQLKTQIDLDTVALKDLEEQAKQTSSVFKTQMKLAADKVKDLGSKVTSVGKNLTTSITLPIVAAGTAAVKFASDYEENLNKVDVAFKDSADVVKEWAKTATEQFGLSENAALEATSLFGDMGTSMGLTTEEASDMSTSLAGLAGDLSSFKNVDIDQAMNALKGVFTGETESLKNLGIVMTETNLKEFAESIGLTYDEMSQAEKVTLRYQYVLQNTQNAQGDYARTSDGTANSMRTLQASLDNLAVTFGQVLIPVITPVINKITEIIQKFGELDEGTKKVILIVAGVAAVIGPLITVIGSLISSVGIIMGAIAGISAPVLGVIAVITALIAAGVLLYQNWDWIKEKAGELGNWISEKWNGIKTSVSNAWEGMKTATSNAWANVKSTVEKNGGGIKGVITTATQAYLNIWKNAFNAIDNATGNKLSAIKDKFVSVFNNIKSFVQSAVDRIKNIFNFSWSLPDIRLPHFSVSGGFSLNPPQVPHISVQWYKKAMSDAYMLNGATIFGAKGGSLLGGGESGSEMIIGTNKLLSMIAQAKGGETVITNTFNINGTDKDPQTLAQEISFYLDMELQRTERAFA